MSNRLRRMQKRIERMKTDQEEPKTEQNEVLVHGAMMYKCGTCGREWWMFLEKGIEEFGENHKPTPFIIRCKCGGQARDISGICKLPRGGYESLPAGESYFANREDSECGVAVLM